MKFFLHYRPNDGEILAWETTLIPGTADGCERLELDTKIDINPKTQRICEGEIVQKSDAEQRAALLPTERDVHVLVYHELCATDSFVVPDRPMDDEMRTAWKTYRQALRDLSKYPSPIDMVRQWPVRPDGIDARTQEMKSCASLYKQESQF